MVEDDPNFSEIIRTFHKEVPKMIGGGSELIVIQTISMLRHILAVGDIQFVILDLTLTDSMQVDTIELIGREHKTMPPIYVITGDERIEVRDKCIAMGAVGFALKQHIVHAPNFFFASVYNEYIKALEHG